MSRRSRPGTPMPCCCGPARWWRQAPRRTSSPRAPCRTRSVSHCHCRGPMAASRPAAPPDRRLTRVPAMAEAPEFVTLQVADGVGTIRLDRPKMNAINEQLHLEVRATAMEAGERADVRAVVLYGGERVFAAGADIKAMSQLDRTAMVAWGRELTNSFTAVARLPKPVIA